MLPHPKLADWRMRLVLSTLMAFAAISTDLYLPALPQVATALQAAPGRVSLTIAAYLVGFSAGQLVWGPIGDRFGRRRPIAAGVVLFIIGSAGCATAGSVDQLLMWRVVQAVGACAGVVLARAIVRDLYDRDRAAQMMSQLLIVMLVAPLVGPSIGGQILALAGWRAIFWTLVAVGGATLFALLLLPETLPPERRNRETLLAAFKGYGGLMRHRSLLLYAGVISFLYCGTFAYISASPFAYIAFYHLPPQFYGLVFGAGVVGIMLSNIVN
eukprot:gene11983-12072_t